MRDLMENRLAIRLAAIGLVSFASVSFAQDLRQVRGVLRFTDASTPSGTIENVPIQFVQVGVVPSHSPLSVKFVTTGWNGDYSAVFPAWALPAGSTVALTFRARNYAADVYLDLDGTTIEWMTWTVQGVVPSGTGDVVLNGTVSRASLSAHFNIAHGMRLGHSYASYNRGDDDDITRAEVQYPDSDWSHFSAWSDEITLSGPVVEGEDGTYGGNATDHGFSDRTILHEYAHHLTDDISDHDGSGGDHFAWSDLGFEFAWSEGFATYFAHAVELAFGQVAVDGSIEAIPRISMQDQQDGAPYLQTMIYPAGSEGITQSCLWDVHDGGSGESFDGIAGTTAIRRTIFEIFDREIDEGEAASGADIERTILGFHEAWRQRRGEASHAALDRILFAHNVSPHGKQNYAVTSVAASKTSVEPGETMNVTVGLSRANWLYGAMLVKVKLQLYQGGTTPVVYTLTTVDWNPVATTSLVVSVTMPMAVNAGSYKVRAIVDPLGLADESNEADNTRSSSGNVELEGLFSADYDPWAQTGTRSSSSTTLEDLNAQVK